MAEAQKKIDVQAEETVVAAAVIQPDQRPVEKSSTPGSSTTGSSTARSSTEGMEDFFRSPDAVVLTVKEACKRLGIRKKNLHQRIAQGMYKTFAGVDGNLRVMLPADAKREVVHPRDLVQQARREPLELVTISAQANQLISDPQLANLLEKLFNQMSAAAVRIGYLESQLEQYNQQVTVLPDLPTHIAESLSIKKQNDMLRTRLTDIEDQLAQARKPIWTKFIDWLLPNRES
jgi:hypothetical protein